MTANEELYSKLLHYDGLSPLSLEEEEFLNKNIPDKMLRGNDITKFEKVLVIGGSG